MIDIIEYFCTYPDCRHYGLRNQGNLVKSGTYTVKGDKRQMLQCKVCNERFSETHNTVFFHSHYPSATIRNIINCPAESNGVRATSRMLELSKNGVNKVVLKAGEHCKMVLSNLLTSLHLEECQLDELWTFVQKKSSFRRRTDPRIWAHMGLDSLGCQYQAYYLFLVGDRTLNDCRLFFNDLLRRITNKPLFVSDELPHYGRVILENYHTVEEVEKTGLRGHPKNP